MTPQEFRAWFEGFTESLEGRPSAKQWERICDRVKEIDGRQIERIVYQDRWPTYYYTTWNALPLGYSTCSANSSQSACESNHGSNEYVMLNAMADAGRAEFTALARSLTHSLPPETQH